MNEYSKYRPSAPYSKVLARIKQQVVELPSFSQTKYENS